MVSLKKKTAFFRLFRREKKSLPPCMSHRCENKGISMCLKKHHFKKIAGWWVIDYLLLNCGILCINGSELWPPIRAVEREATVLLEPGRPWKKNQYSSVKMSRQPAIVPLSVKYLRPSQDLGLKQQKFRALPHAPLLLLWSILTGLKSRWFV